ncbi:MAG: IscS subfamily cysteine desulfurase [Pseudomonadota bacterium]
MNDKPIYLDFAATTPVDKRVAARMAACLTDEGVFANPASTSHTYGQQARQAVNNARAQVASLIGAQPEHIVFTSGATEADNLAIKGVARASAASGRRHIVTAKTEHKAVLDTCRQLEAEGCQVTYLVPAEHGRVTAAQVQSALRDETCLVSIMHVNNEIGVINPIDEIGHVCAEAGVPFHVDAAQSAGKVAIDLSTINVNLLSLAAHKVYGPKGIGALYVKPVPRLRIEPILHGGGHELGLRSGTLATHQIVGMGEAFALAERELEAEHARLAQLRARLLDGLLALDAVQLNGGEPSVPGIVNVSFAQIEGESLMYALRPLAVASSAACGSASSESSYVLRALGHSDQLAQSSVRFSLGRSTTPAHIDRAIEVVTRAVTRLRALSPAADGSRAKSAIKEDESQSVGR